MSTHSFKASSPGGAKKALRLTPVHVPRPRLEAAIERMKRGEFIEAESVDDFRRAVEGHKRKLAVR